MKKIELIIDWETYKENSILGFYNVSLPEEKPTWFDICQLTALRTIWAHMLNKHLFPYNPLIFDALKEEYVDIVTASICSQIDYVYQNLQYRLNMIDEQRSTSINRFSEGPIDYRVLKDLVVGLEPMTYMNLASIGWLYNGVHGKLKYKSYYNILEDDSNDKNSN